MSEFKAEEIAGYIQLLLQKNSELEERIRQLEGQRTAQGITPPGIPFIGETNAIAPQKMWVSKVSSISTLNQQLLVRRCYPQASVTTPWTIDNSLRLIPVKYPANQPIPAVDDFIFVHYTGTFGTTVATAVYGYIDRAGGGSDIIRFSLTTTLALDSNAIAKRLVWDGAAYVTDGSTFTIYASIGGLYGPAKPTSQGWAIKLQDRNVYEVIYMQRMAEFIEFRLLGGVSAGYTTTGFTVTDYWTGYKPPDGLTLEYPPSADVRFVSSGDWGNAVYDEQENIYRAFEIDQRLWISASSCGGTLPTEPSQRVTWLNFGAGLSVSTIGTGGDRSISNGWAVSDSQDGGDSGPYVVPHLNLGAMIIISSVGTCTALCGVRTFHTTPRTVTFVTTVYCAGGLIKGCIQTVVFNEHGFAISITSPVCP